MNISDLMDMLKNPKAMQARVEELRDRTARVRATGSSGAGMVRITLSGDLEMISCEIAPEIVDPGEIGMLQDLVRAAYNDASAKVREALQKELASGMEGIPMPPGFGGLGFPAGNGT